MRGGGVKGKRDLSQTIFQTLRTDPIYRVRFIARTSSQPATGQALVLASHPDRKEVRAQRAEPLRTDRIDPVRFSARPSRWVS